MRLAHLGLAITLLICPAVSAMAGQVNSSALIGEQLDKQIPAMNIQGGLLDVTKAIANQTGVRIEAPQAVYDALPWGEDTTITINVKNTTLRQTLDSVARRLGLTFTLGAEAVELEPTPALRRLGRRATLQEVQVLDLLASAPLDPSTPSPTVQQLLDSVDHALAERKSPFAIENRAFAKDESATINIARNATLMDALESLAGQTDATWYPWGHSLVVVKKVDAVRLLLGKRITRRFRDVQLQQVLAELAEYTNVHFAFDPGVLGLVPARYQRITLSLDSATVQQTLDILSGATGLKFTPATDGVEVSYAGATAGAATRAVQ